MISNLWGTPFTESDHTWLVLGPRLIVKLIDFKVTNIEFWFPRPYNVIKGYQTIYGQAAAQQSSLTVTTTAGAAS